MDVQISTLIKDASTQTLGSLCAILKKGADHAAALKFPEEVLLNYRLFPDMFPLSRQVQIATDTMTRGAARLAGTDLPSFPDVETSFAQLIDRTNRLLGVMNARTGQLTDSLTALSGLSREIDAKSDVIAELMSAAAPATDTLAQRTTQIADLVVEGGSTAEMLRRFPSVAGTDTSGRSMIADLNTMSSALNDAVLDPDTSLLAINRLMPPFIKGFAGNSFAAKGSIDRLVLGSIPDIGFPGDPGLHGPKWSTWNQMVGSFQYTLLRLQERIVGRGPNVPQVPVIPSPTDPGQWAVHGPPPGSTGPGS